MSTVLTVIAVSAVMIFVGWPLVRPDSEDEDGGESLSPLERQKVEAYGAIKEAEFDLRMGKLSQADFETLTERYRGQALEAIAALEQSRAPARAVVRQANVRAGRRFAFCPDCGEKTAPRANFCGACGRTLQEEVA
jgi:membrane protease subunit (stomatin/prohibitin family)